MCTVLGHVYGYGRDDPLRGVWCASNDWNGPRNASLPYLMTVVTSSAHTSGMTHPPTCQSPSHVACEVCRTAIDGSSRSLCLCSWELSPSASAAGSSLSLCLCSWELSLPLPLQLGALSLCLCSWVRGIPSPWLAVGGTVWLTRTCLGRDSVVTRGCPQFRVVITGVSSFQGRY